MSAKDEVRNASNKFYAGLNRMANGESNALTDAWLHTDSVTAMHPIGGREVGWDAVRESFDQVAKMASEGKIELKDQMIHVLGDVAYEVGIELARFKLADQAVKGEIRITNIYRTDGKTWKLVHHHTDIAPPMIEVLNKLQAVSEPSKG
jgi:ketosteroid isomerase-like protein